MPTTRPSSAHKLPPSWGPFGNDVTLAVVHPRKSWVALRRNTSRATTVEVLDLNTGVTRSVLEAPYPGMGLVWVGDRAVLLAWTMEKVACVTIEGDGIDVVSLPIAETPKDLRTERAGVTTTITVKLDERSVVARLWASREGTQVDPKLLRNVEGLWHPDGTCFAVGGRPSLVLLRGDGRETLSPPRSWQNSPLTVLGWSDADHVICSLPAGPWARNPPTRTWRIEVSSRTWTAMHLDESRSIRQASADLSPDGTCLAMADADPFVEMCRIHLVDVATANMRRVQTPWKSGHSFIWLRWLDATRLLASMYDRLLLLDTTTGVMSKARVFPKQEEAWHTPCLASIEGNDYVVWHDARRPGCLHRLPITAFVEVEKKAARSGSARRRREEEEE